MAISAVNHNEGGSSEFSHHSYRVSSLFHQKKKVNKISSKNRGKQKIFDKRFQGYESKVILLARRKHEPRQLFFTFAIVITT